MGESRQSHHSLFSRPFASFAGQPFPFLGSVLSAHSQLSREHPFTSLDESPDARRSGSRISPTRARTRFVRLGYRADWRILGRRPATQNRALIPVWTVSRQMGSAFGGCAAGGGWGSVQPGLQKQRGLFFFGLADARQAQRAALAGFEFRQIDQHDGSQRSP